MKSIYEVIKRFFKLAVLPALSNGSEPGGVERL